MATATALDELTALIDSGKELLTESNFNKSKMTVWQIQGKRVLASVYDEEIAREFSSLLGGGMVITRSAPESYYYNHTYRPRIQRAIELLESLQATELPKQPAKPATAPATPQSISVQNGTVVFGNNNTVSNVTVKDMLETLQNEIQATVPESEEKRGALSALKALTSNETVNTVIGQTLGAFLAHIK